MENHEAPTTAPAAKLRDELRNEIESRKAEREALHRRAELLHLAGQIANGMMSVPAVLDKAPLEGVANASVQLAVHIVNGIDRALSPIVQPENALAALIGKAPQ